MKQLPVLAFALMAPAVPAMARRAVPHVASWTVVGSDGPQRTVTLKRGKLEAVGFVVPSTLLRLNEDAVTAGGVVAIAKGTALLPIDHGDQNVCEVLRDVGSAFSCLADTDGDGRFDRYFGTQVFNEIFFGSIGDDGGFEPLAAPVGVTAVNAGDLTPPIALELRYEGSSTSELRFRACVSIARDKIVFGRDGKVSRSCQQRSTTIRYGGVPVTASLYGVGMTFRSVSPNTAMVEVTPATTNQPFSTSFRFP